jgi:hypothetical protein
VFPFLAQVEVEVGTSQERAKEGGESRGLLCRRPPFGPDFHQQGDMRVTCKGLFGKWSIQVDGRGLKGIFEKF